jgi:hypothetical protein
MIFIALGATVFLIIMVHNWAEHYYRGDRDD